MKNKILIVLLLCVMLSVSGCTNQFNQITTFFNEMAARVNYDVGVFYYSLGEQDTAIIRFSAAINLNPNFIDSYIYRGNSYCAKEQYDLAITDYSKAIELDPGNIDAYLGRGNTYCDKKQYDMAIADFSKVIELDPNDAVAYYDRGNAYSEIIPTLPSLNGGTILLNNSDHLDQAIADYSKSIELDPGFASAYYNRGCVYSDKKQYDLAIADYSKAIELDPMKADAYNNRGNAYSSKGKYDLAIGDYTKSIELDPTDAQAYYNRGDEYAKLGNRTSAITDLENCIKISQDRSLTAKAQTLLDKLRKQLPAPNRFSST